MVLRSRLALVAALASAALVVATPSLAGARPSDPGAAAGSTGSPDGLSLVAVRQSLLGSHEWYQQTYHGRPVLAGFYAVHTDSRTGQVQTQDGRLTVGGAPALTARFAGDRAQTMAAGRLGGSAL